MTGTHHDATHGHQRRRGETVLLGSQQGRDHHVAARFHLSIRFDDDTAAQVVEQQSLMRFRQPQFPRHPGVLDTPHGRRPGAAIVAANQDNVGVPLGHSGSNRAHADLRHQFDADPGLRIGVL